MDDSKIVEKNLLCIKCKSTPALVYRPSYQFCQECFKSTIYRKYRIGLALPKRISSSLAVLFDYQSPNDRLLLWLLYCDKKTKRDSFPELRIFSSETTPQYQDECMDYLAKYGLSCHFVRVPSCSTIEDRSLPAQERSKAINFAAFLEQASQSGCQFFVTGDTCTKLAADILTHICLGRGQLMPWFLLDQQTFTLPTGSSITVLRPLREIQAEDVQDYLRIIDELPIEWTSSSPKDTVSGLVNGFFQETNQLNSFNINNVFTTAKRIATSWNELPNCKACERCFAPLIQKDSSECLLCQYP